MSMRRQVVSKIRSARLAISMTYSGLIYEPPHAYICGILHTEVSGADVGPFEGCEETVLGHQLRRDSKATCGPIDNQTGRHLLLTVFTMLRYLRVSKSSKALLASHPKA